MPPGRPARSAQIAGVSFQPVFSSPPLIPWAAAADPRRTVQRICATFPKGDCPFAFQIVYNIQYAKIVFFCQKPAAKLLQLLPHPLFWDRVPRSFQIQGSPSTAVRYSMRSRVQKNGPLRTSMRLFLYNCSRSERLRSSKKPALDLRRFYGLGHQRQDLYSPGVLSDQ